MNNIFKTAIFVMAMMISAMAFGQINDNNTTPNDNNNNPNGTIYLTVVTNLPSATLANLVKVTIRWYDINDNPIGEPETKEASFDPTLNFSFTAPLGMGVPAYVKYYARAINNVGYSYNRVVEAACGMYDVDICTPPCPNILTIIGSMWNGTFECFNLGPVMGESPIGHGH